MSGIPARVREDFPRARTMAYFDNASSHPISVHSAAALHRYVDWVTHEVGEPWWPAWAAPWNEVKTLFARLINADPGEIAFARSTVESESNILNGLRDHLAGGNVVISDLASIPAYTTTSSASAAGSRCGSSGTATGRSTWPTWSAPSTAIPA